MQTRRDFCRNAAGMAVLGLASTSLEAIGMSEANEANEAEEKYRVDRPLHQLQQEFVDLRFGMFLHFNMATFQDREWGDPTGPAEAFHPTNLDTDQWALAAKSAGMTYGCLTTKHHDGFCIWPTKTRSASVRNTSHKIDVVKAYADSFRKHGLKVALYYSILDLREDIRHFNVTPDKIKLIKDQLTELLTQYGEVNALIIDGWDAPWSRITYEEIPFHEIYALVKKLQPNCLISELNAGAYPASALYYSDIKAFEQNAGQMLPGDSDVPALSCVTLTDGWFWKQSDVNADLKPMKRIVEEWLIPQNERFCNLILNAPPNREGRLSPNVIARLEEIGKAWKHGGPVGKINPSVVITMPNLATARPIHASSSPDTNGPDLANDGRFGSAWSTDSSGSGWLEVEIGKHSFTTAVFIEPVSNDGWYGRESRIKKYRWERWDGAKWVEIVSGGTPRHVQIDQFPRVTASKVRLSFEGDRDSVAIAEIGLYDEPVR